MRVERHEATVEALSRQALEQVDEIIADVLTVLVAAEPAGFFDDEGLADLETSARVSMLSLLSFLAATPSDGGDPLEVARATGRRQVQQDLPLEGVLTSYRTVGQLLWDRFVSLARAGGDPVGDALLDGASLVWSVIDVHCAAVTEAYREEEGLLRRRDERVQAAVLAGLLEGRGGDAVFARDAAHALGVPRSGPFVCVVGILERAQDRLRSIGTCSAWLTLPESDVGLIALGARGAAGVREVLAPAGRGPIGMSPVFTELSQLPRARHFAELAAQAPGTPTAVRVIDEDLVAGLVVADPEVASLIYDRTVGALLEAEPQDGIALLESVRASLAAEGSLNEAAVKLFVHRNTLLYRLQKVERLTGVSVRSLQDQVQWVLALKEHDVRVARGGA